MNLEKAAYLNKLQSRLDYFKNKPITELKRSEIDEYLALLNEINNEVYPILDPIWKSIKAIVSETPQFKAEMKYQERVLNRR